MEDVNLQKLDMLKTCKTTAEIIALAKADNVELSEDQANEVLSIYHCCQVSFPTNIFKQ